ncbi:MAG: putative nicotinamide N-methyase [Hyphomicrobiaceae bacterium]|jgi:predicted nicotinamide N-methyase
MTSPNTDKRAQSFILANTGLLRPPLVPEVQLHLAEESLPIWRKTEEELGEMNVPPPYWAFAWAGGQALARYILDEPQTVAGKSALDIGSGSGLVAIAAMLAGARQVIANDIDAYAIEACRMNAAVNNVTIALRHDDLIGSILNESISQPPEIIFLADVFYEKELATDVLDFAAATRACGSRILIGDPRRSYFPEKRFAKIASYAVPVTRDLEDAEIKNSAVWEFLE